MIRLDKIKIVTDINHIKDIDKNQFLTNIQGEKILYYKYQQALPFLLTILADIKKGELTIEFTGKILLDEYPYLINQTNIRKCFDRINEMGICRLDIDAILVWSEVVKCDITLDVAYPLEEITFIQHHITNYYKWDCRKYEQNGITIANKVKTAKYKKRFSIYDKSKELEKASNREFLQRLKDKQGLLDHFKGKTRFELNIVTKQQIRDLLHTMDCSLSSVLSSTANPILTVFDEAINLNTESAHCTNLKDYKNLLVLKDCDFDLKKVDAQVRSYSSCYSTISRQMKDFAELYHRLQGDNQQKDIRRLLIQDKVENL